MRIAVTGSSGKLGAATVRRLEEDGHIVVGFDQAGAVGSSFTRVRLDDYGQVLDALLGVTARHEGLDAVVHAAAIPVNGIVPDAETFRNNMLVTFNVAHAAMRAGIRTLIAASSITALGFPFQEPPASLPIDERTQPRANNTYGLVKVLEEAMFRQLVRWDPRLAVRALRFTNIADEGDYPRVRENAHRAEYRRNLLWTYVDVRDGAEAFALALAAARPGFEAYNIAAADSASSIPSLELAAQAFPDTPIDGAVDRFGSLMSIGKARRELGYEPRHTWRRASGR